MRKIIILFLYTFLFSNTQYYNNLFFLFNKNSDVDILSSKQNLKTGMTPKIYGTKNIKNDKIKAVLASALLPGSGQYFINNQKTKGIVKEVLISKKS